MSLLCYTQLALPYMRRGSLWPIPGYDARPESRVALRSTREWLYEATARCAAVIMVGGHAGRMRSTLAGGGALRIANRFLEEGKPVFPISLHRRRLGRGVPGGARPGGATVRSPGCPATSSCAWRCPAPPDTGDLADLLLGALADTPDVFISYRRHDAAWAGGTPAPGAERALSGTQAGLHGILDDISARGPRGTRRSSGPSPAVGSASCSSATAGSITRSPTPCRPRLHGRERLSSGRRSRTLLESWQAGHRRPGRRGTPQEADDLPPDSPPAEPSVRQVPVTNATWEIDVEQIVDKIRRVLSDCSTPGPMP